MSILQSIQFPLFCLIWRTSFKDAPHRSVDGWMGRVCLCSGCSCGCYLEGLVLLWAGRFPLGLIGLFFLLSKDSQESSPTPRFKSITSLALSLLYGAALITSIHDYWKNHSFDYMDLCWQSDVSAFLICCLVLSFLNLYQLKNLSTLELQGFLEVIFVT